MRNLKKLLNLLLEERSITTMYHVTETKNVASILEHGLDPKRRSKMSGFTTGSISKYYWDDKDIQHVPIFLSVSSEKDKTEDTSWGGGQLGAGYVKLKINIAQIPLVADIPMLVELIGTKYDQLILLELDTEDSESWRTRNQEAFDTLMPHAKENKFTDGSSEFILSYVDLATPNSPVALAAIDFTGTAACYEKIAPDRITVVKEYL